MSLQERRKVLKRFAIFCFGIFLAYSGYLVMISLQSSINIKHGVGVASITVTYATSAFFGIFFTPVIVRKWGSRACLLFCEFTIIAYIAANAYPKYYTLMTAGVLTGMGEATMWPVMALFVVHYARCYARHASESVDKYLPQFFGVFYAVFQLSSVCGNLLSYAILFGGKSPQNFSNDTTASTPMQKDLSYCGKNDCQNPNITNSDSNRYEPASTTLIYILVGVTSGLGVLAMFIHGCLIKPIDSSLEVEDGYFHIEEMKQESTWKFISSTVKETFRHIVNPKQLLLMPFALYAGLFTSFLMTEVPRAFGSCILGVDKVGLLSALAALVDAFMAVLSLKLVAWFGRDIPILIGYCLDISNYLICIFWVPSDSSLWVVYIIFLMIGLIDGVWRPLVNEMYASNFTENRDIALTVWNLFVLLGLMWQTAWSTSVCVYFKIYFQMGFLTFALVCYAIYRRVYGSTNSINMNENGINSYKKLENT